MIKTQGSIWQSALQLMTTLHLPKMHPLNRYFLCLVFIPFFCCVPVFGLNLLGVWEQETAIETNIIESLSSSVVVLDNETTSGRQTGILAKVGGESVILTNYHILNKVDDTVFVYITGKSGRLYKFGTKLIRGDKSLDLALYSVNVSTLASSLESLKQDGFQVGDKTNNILCPVTNTALKMKNCGLFEYIRRGSDIMFLGFPIGQGTKSGSLQRTVKLSSGEEVVLPPLITLYEKEPIARFGKIASKSDGNSFLIDAMVSHGSSGSPVFVRHREGDTLSYLFIGLIRGFRADNVAFHSEDGQVISIPHNSGLGEVISLEAILRFVKDLD